MQNISLETWLNETMPYWDPARTIIGGSVRRVHCIAGALKSQQTPFFSLHCLLIFLFHTWQSCLATLRTIHIPWTHYNYKVKCFEKTWQNNLRRNCGHMGMCEWMWSWKLPTRPATDMDLYLTKKASGKCWNDSTTGSSPQWLPKNPWKTSAHL